MNTSRLITGLLSRLIPKVGRIGVGRIAERLIPRIGSSLVDFEEFVKLKPITQFALGKAIPKLANVAENLINPDVRLSHIVDVLKKYRKTGGEASENVSVSELQKISEQQQKKIKKQLSILEKRKLIEQKKESIATRKEKISELGKQREALRGNRNSLYNAAFGAPDTISKRDNYNAAIGQHQTEGNLANGINTSNMITKKKQLKFKRVNI